MTKGLPLRNETQAGLTGCAQEMRPELQRFLLARRCDPAEVDDLLQSLFVKLASGKTGPVTNPRAYLYQMANNLLHDARRMKNRQEARDDGWARSAFGMELDRDPNPSPEDIAVQREALRKVEDLLSQMPERTAQILRLYRVEGQSQRSIAQSMDISLSAVEKHLQRAYRELIAFKAEQDEQGMLP